MPITPNMLSVFRLILVPTFVSVFFSDLENARMWAVLIYVIASITDVLDGWMARKFDLTSNLGRILDPLGDKLLAAAMLFCLSSVDVIPNWIFGIYVGKELFLTTGSLVIAHKTKCHEVPPSNYVGKVATVTFFVVCLVLATFESIPESAALIMICLALGISILALVIYGAGYVIKPHKTDIQ